MWRSKRTIGCVLVLWGLWAWTGTGQGLAKVAPDEQPIVREGAVPGWLKLGTDAAGYVIGTLESDEGKVAFIRSVDPKPLKYGSLLQSFHSDDYKGKRMRLRARIRTEGVQNSASMWMRVDREQEIVAFDNMAQRPIRGTTDWREYSIVLDVPQISDTILFGLALQGEGMAVWDDIRFEEVGPDVPLTGLVRQNRKTGPANLDFDQ